MFFFIVRTSNNTSTGSSLENRDISYSERLGWFYIVIIKAPKFSCYTQQKTTRKLLDKTEDENLPESSSQLRCGPSDQQLITLHFFLHFWKWMQSPRPAFFLIYFIEVQLIYSVVLISAVQPRNSVIYLCTFLFRALSFNCVLPEYP